MIEAVSFPSIAPGHRTSGPFTGPYGLEIGPPKATCDARKVKVVDEKKRASTAKATMVSPFTGKTYAWPKYRKSLDVLPTEDFHAVIYDNSRDEKFHGNLVRTVRKRFKSWTIIKDDNPPITFDTANRKEQWEAISHRLAFIYGMIYRAHVSRDLGLVFNLEDDVEIPKNAWSRLNRIMDERDDIGTVIAKCRDRRWDDGYLSSNRPIAFNFEPLGFEIGGACSGPEEIRVRILDDKDFGVEQIGTGHMGCWLTRTAAFDDCTMGEPTYRGLIGPDLIWGWRQWEAGWRFVTDWSLECRHWRMTDGVLNSV